MRLEHITEKALSWHDDERRVVPHTLLDHPVAQVAPNRWLVSAMVYGPDTWAPWVSSDGFDHVSVGIWLFDNNLELLDLWEWRISTAGDYQVGDFLPWVNNHTFFGWGDKALLVVPEHRDLPWAHSDPPSVPAFRLVWVEDDQIQVGPPTYLDQFYSEGRIGVFAPGEGASGMFHQYHTWMMPDIHSLPDLFVHLTHDGESVTVTSTTTHGTANWPLGIQHVRDDLYLFAGYVNLSHSLGGGNSNIFWLIRSDGTVIDHAGFGTRDESAGTYQSHFHYFSSFFTYTSGNQLWRMNDNKFAAAAYYIPDTSGSTNLPVTAHVDVGESIDNITVHEHLPEPVTWNQKPWTTMGHSIITHPSLGAAMPGYRHYIPYGNDGLPLEDGSAEALMEPLLFDWMEGVEGSIYDSLEVGPSLFIGDRVCITSGSEDYTSVGMFRVGELGLRIKQRDDGIKRSMPRIGHSGAYARSRQRSGRVPNFNTYP